MWPFSGSCSSKARLVGKTVIITGANCGIGKETARDFYRRGARVILACRDSVKAQEAIEDLRKNPPAEYKGEQFEGAPGELAFCRLNLNSLASVRECARNLVSTEPALHILVNNAGVMMCPYETTEDGFENHLQTNHLGHFLLTILLLPKLRESAPGCRVVTVSSRIHIIGNIHFDDLNLEKSYTPLKGYAQSKLANILFTTELAERLKDANITGINVYSLHPGVIRTEISRHFDVTIFRGITRLFKIPFPFVKSIEQGAQTTIHCGVDETAGKETGLYYADCRPTKPWNKTINSENAKQLWNLSCELVGLQPTENLSLLLKEAAQQASIKV